MGFISHLGGGHTHTHAHIHKHTHIDNLHRINFKKPGTHQPVAVLVCTWFKSTHEYTVYSSYVYVFKKHQLCICLQVAMYMSSRPQRHNRCFTDIGMNLWPIHLVLLIWYPPLAYCLSCDCEGSQNLF